MRSVTREAVAPRLLLSAPGRFFARDRELAALDRSMAKAAERASPGLLVLTGLGGVGKTALALHWIHRKIELFPDGQLYADLGAFGVGGAIEPGVVLARFLRALGVPADQVPHDLAEQSGLYRSVTAERSLAVLLDDAESISQVRPLLTSGAGTMVVVTSRRRINGLALHDADVLPLEPLDEPSSLGLLGGFIGEERVEAEMAQARRLVSLCGGIPLTLRLAAARLKSRKHRSIVHLVTELVDERKRLTGLNADGGISIGAAFDLSYRGLSPEARRLYRCLGLQPCREFGVGATAAALSVSEGEADELVDELVDSSMLTEIGADRYRFHDLVRLHARQQAEEDDRTTEMTAVLKRVVTWYLDNAIAAEMRVTPMRRRCSRRLKAVDRLYQRFADPETGLAWIEHELPNLVATQQTAADHGWYDLVWEFGEALWGFFLYRKHYAEWLATDELAVEAAGRCGDPVAEGRIHIYLGYMHLNLEQFGSAEREFTTALRLSRETGDRTGESTALEHLGLVERATNRTENALTTFRRAAELSDSLADGRAEALNLRRIGDTLCETARPQEAVEYLRKVVAVATDLGDNVLRARALTSLGTAHLRCGLVSESLAELREAAAVLSRSGSDYYHGEALEALSKAFEHVGDSAAATGHLRCGLLLYIRSGGPRAERARARLAALERDR